MSELGTPFREAVDFAIAAHRDQRRKGTDITYLSHLLAVAALALEAGADEELAIAALLHDTAEDTDATVDDVRERFGHRVAEIVRACSDTEVIPKPPWRQRKEAYIEHLEATDDAGVLLVSLADKLHNARSLLDDLHSDGPGVWDRFNAGPDDQLWYYRSLADLFARKLPSRNALALAATVDDLARTVR